jgi:hypothetical protein
MKLGFSHKIRREIWDFDEKRRAVLKRVGG